MTIDNLPNLWAAMDGCMEAHESLVESGHKCEHRQFAESLDCNGWVHGIT